MNEVLKCIEERSSIRKFTDVPLTVEEVEALKKAALQSPTARNLQRWHFSFVQNKDLIDRLENKMLENATEEAKARAKERGMSFFFNPPLMVFISSQDLTHFALVDAGIAVENIALAAQSLGLRSTIIGCCKDLLNEPENEDLRTALGFPEGYKFAIAIVVGHPNINKVPHALNPDKITEL